MASTTAGAVKALVESLGLSLSAYRRRVPDGTTLPYVRISERIALTPSDADNAFNSDDSPFVEQVQVDLFQQEHDDDGRVESYTLPDALARGLHGARLSGPTHVYGCRVVQGPLELPDEENLVRHVLTLEVNRNL